MGEKGNDEGRYKERPAEEGEKGNGRRKTKLEPKEKKKSP